MLKNYLVVAWRQLLKQKTYTAINITGLALGVACCTLIALFIRHELSFDGQWAASDRIFRISRDFFSVNGSAETHFAGIAPAAAPLLKEQFPEIERIARLSRCGAAGGGVLISNGDRAFYERGFSTADADFLKIFDFTWLQGSADTALAQPGSVVITASAARRYFDAESAIGRTLYLDNLNNATKVTGVIADLPDNTHLRFDFLFHIQGTPGLDTWTAGDCFMTYALLTRGANIDSVRRGSAQFFDTRYQAGSSKATGFTATPIADIHLRSNRQGEMRTPGSMATVYTFGAIAAFVLLIACINFMNLATARAAQRAKEVGMRKAIGATRVQLIAQFLGESLLLTAIAVAAAVAIVAAALPPFSAFVEKRIGLADLAAPDLVSLLAALTLTVGLVAGGYPAFFLSAFKPIRVLKGEVTRGSGAAVFRKGLVVVQFAISIALVIATIVVFQQASFARNFELGYNKDQIVVLTGSLTGGLGPQWESMKRRWLANPEIRGVTASNTTPGTQNDSAALFRTAGGTELNATQMFVEFDFFETYGIDLVAGRTFSDERGTDRAVPPTRDAPPPPRSSFVLSELAARRLGWTPEEAIGEFVDRGGLQGVVIGVVEDVYFESVRNAVKPIVYLVPPIQTTGFRTIREASIRVSGRDVPRTLAYIDATWKQFVTDQPVTRRFLDQDFEVLYRGEQRQAEMFTAFASLAIVVACLGLFGLAAFTTARRTKEIGLRKTLGARVGDIVRLFTVEFGTLVLLANLFAWPAAFVLMRRWLGTFSYRVELGPTVFVASGLLALLIASLTVAGVASRAALAKPVKALRHE
ncbi:MAG TPA: ABC transporter permease [Gammaproteobacteria bacterium]|nr:ABC transporter permease [Gammaproteobacteria bacterium]